MKPLMVAFFHGIMPCSSSARSMVENSQVRMMSWLWERSEYGNTRSNSSGSDSQPPAICGVSEDVAQVSMMSTSPMKPPGSPRWLSSYPGAGSDAGSTGSTCSLGTIGVSRSGSPSASSGYQTGIGTPKKRCLDISQSPVSPPTQFS